MEQEERLGRFSLLQRADVFQLCGDTLALGEFATVKKGNLVCDLGCGSGALGLLLAQREPTVAVTGVELCPHAVDLARENFARNKMDGVVLHADLRFVSTLLPGGTHHLVVSNPPYFAVGTGDSGGMARMEERCVLDDVCSAANWLLKQGGRFALVFRPERLVDLICSLRAYKLEPKRMQLICHTADAAPSAVLLEAIKYGRTGLAVLPPRLR